METARINATVKRVTGEKGEDGCWTLAFEFFGGGVLCFRFTFVAKEPYLFSKEDWLTLARGEKTLNLCNGDGKCSIGPVKGTGHKGKNLRFTIETPNVCAGFEVPLVLASKMLRGMVDDAVAKGLRFSENKPC